ncbi:acyltransferase domain-containing protein [Corticibacter populi]|uniref:Acyltransferase domain-containing protein n=1 Tax=Corticibacter populi TaxID=1550736 RepID=A0A3M6QUA5_9BURK|nr:acyltransferase domain-containing protein [Corticibacter populi]RMX06614.1 acyltransferase domain-containing protein [Corticibacter populi]RZS31817.1 [acyl-carrier-protein] S-malonyltransferase [Corticibacter populi]
MALALLFSGQGMQHPQMLPWLRAEDPLLRQMQQQLGVADWRLALQSPAWASANAHAQLVLTATALAAWAQLSAGAALPRPVVVAGYSVGELAACSVAGMFDAATALALAQRRAEAMDAAAAGQDFAMLAVSGLALARLERLCQVTGTALAIRNGPDNAVCAGPRPQLGQLHTQAEGQGAHCTPLAVRTASHTPWMEAAAQQFEAELARRPLQAPQLPWPCNTGEVVWSAEAARRALARQVVQTVQWQDCMEQVRERQPTAVLEIGPGQSLATMWNRRYPDIPARSADEFKTRAALLRWLQQPV